MKNQIRFISAFVSILLVAGSLGLAQNPGWTPVGGQSYTMMVTAKIEDPDNAGSYLNDVNDLVAAFVDTEVRGVASPDVDGYIYLSVGSNLSSGEEITFRAYIEIEDEQYPLELYEEDGVTLVDPVIFENNGQLGTWGDGNFFVFKLGDDNNTVTIDINNDDFGYVVVGGINYEDGETLSIPDGEDVEFTVVPENGYHITSVSYLEDGAGAAVEVFDEDDLEANGSFIYTLEDITTDYTFFAEFTLNTYTIEFHAGNNGSLSGPNPLNLAVQVTGQNSLVYENVPHGAMFFTDFSATHDVTAVGNTGGAQDYMFKVWNDGETTAIYPDFEVTGDMSVTALFMPEGWQPMEGLNYTMTVIANLYIDDVLSMNEDDLVAAFVGNQCRGIGSPDADNNGLVFISIGSNLASGEEVRFEIWDSETGNVCLGAHTIDFLNNSVVGSIANPYVIECVNDLSLTFVNGYTWFSTNINPGTMDLENYFDDFDLTPGDRIIGQSQFAIRVAGAPDFWVGSLTTLDPRKMYRMYRTGAGNDVAAVTGSYETFDPISLNAGFSWLGYLPREAQPINTALVLSPSPAVNDIITRQGAFATYTGTSWIGSLTTLEPGRGYIIKLSSPSVLSYPNNPTLKTAITETDSDNSLDASLKLNKEHQMNILAKLELNRNEYSLDQQDIVYAYIDGEYRGKASPTEYDGLIFLPVGDNHTQSAEVKFKVWVDALGQLLDLSESMAFQPSETIGSLDNPFIFKSSVSASLQEGMLIGKAYPNPFATETIIPVMVNDMGQVKLHVYNSMGQLIKQSEETIASAGTHKLAIKRDNLKAGIYFYIVEVYTKGILLQEKGSVMVK
jgi:hypothetical protein